MNTTPGTRFARLATAARGFLLLALSLPVLWEGQARTLPFLGALAVVWAVAGWHEARVAQPSLWPTLAEASLVGIVCGVALPESPGVLAALVLTPFVAGLRHGNDGAAEALAAQLVAVVGIALTETGAMTTAVGTAIFTWAMVALGLGLVAGFMRASALPDDSLAAYREARRLLSELVDLSGGLSSGLDPMALGSSILTAVADAVPTRSLSLHVRRGDELTALVRSGADQPLDHEDDDRIACRAAAEERLQLDGQVFALPVRTDDGIIAVVAGTLSPGLVPDAIGLRALLDSQADALLPTAVRLDTALLFARFRDAATADERRRLAREMHDGVAQDIASMGYLVDALAAAPASPEQARQLQLLREGITSVVAEVRRSVLTLRSQVDGSESLGAAIGSVARHLSAVSGVPIEVTVKEGTTRLRPEVEAELMRITQEALNNAVRHAQATRIVVSCRVDPPEAEIVVADDGRGLQSKRVDSHGLEIMNERARLVGARLTIGDRPGGGAQVSVRIPGEAAPALSELPRKKESVA
ncbi:MAG: sensor histidine kinase [Nocardioidaceae bacterium]